jgi:hypothetical protein
MKIVILLIMAIILSGCGEEKDSSEKQWRQLFNGKDLNSWQVKISGYPLGTNFGNTFRVENGILKVSYNNYDQFNGEFGHLFFNGKFSDYKLRIEYRFVGDQLPEAPDWAFKNSGVMLHSQSPESMGLNQDFPVSIEAQFLGRRPTANLCTPGTHVRIKDKLVTDHCIESNSPSFHGMEWVTAELVVRNDSIFHHIVNGDTVLTYEKPVIGGDFLPEDYPVSEGTPLSEGYIALQAESHPIEFRKVEILELK